MGWTIEGRALKYKHFILCFLILIISWGTSAQCNFKPIGHRGGSSYYYPENTLISLEQGFIEDIFAAEVDVQFTADSALVLMHDFYIDRTTNGTGYVRDLTLNYLKTLDAGSWKNEKFKGAVVPTLQEALLLANKYQKKLYLNMKVVATKLIAKLLKDNNLPGDIVMLDPDDLEELKDYHRILPNTPMVYFGELPQDIDDHEFYETLKNNGVIALEVPADVIYNMEEHKRNELKEIATANNLELWAYTVNDPAYFKFLKDFGINAIETDRPSVAKEYFCNNGDGGYFPEKRITGQWDFNRNLSGTIGSKMNVVGDTTITGQNIKFGTTESFKIPSIENKEANVALVPAFDPQHALRFFSNIAPEGLPGGLDCDNTYSIVFDLLKPAGKNPYTTILQTSNNNSDDGDFFITGEKNSIGVLEQYSGEFADSTWIRLALVFDLYKEKLEQYIDGTLVSTIALPDSKNGRFCLNNNWGIQSSNLFSDNDGETNPLFVSSVQVRNYTMSAAEVKWLGKVKSSKIEQTIMADEDLVCPTFTEDVKLAAENNTVSLVANAGKGVNYKWEMNDGKGWTDIVGSAFRNQMSGTLRIVSSPDQYNGYLFRCIASIDCKTTSNEFLLKSTTTSISLGFDKNNTVLVYPNPSNGNVFVDLSKSSGKSDIHITSLTGVSVLEQKDASGICNFSLNPGTYLIQVRNNQHSYCNKILINR